MTATAIRRTATDPLVYFGPLVGRRLPEGVAEQPYELFEVRPASPTIGAYVSGVRLDGGMSAELLAELRRALTEFKVLFFRDQAITREQHKAFAAQWGELEQHPFFKHTFGGQSDVDVATLAKDAMTTGVENTWHNDVTWHETPSYAAVLRAVEIPELGGDTLWSDTALAYDVLPDDIKERIDGLQAEHDWIQAFGAGMDEATRNTLREAFGPVTHPVVRVLPETGRRVLFVNFVFTTRILGVSQEESDELLGLLFRHVQRPEFQVRLSWEPNTVAMWDNRACQHYASSDYFPARRVMERISVVGDVPVGVGGS